MEIGEIQRNFVIRKIVKGRVKINGLFYKPDEQWMAYDGRLDGMKYVFGLYQGDSNLVGLWGRPEDLRPCKITTGADDDSVTIETGPHIVDGTLPWLFWRQDCYFEGDDNES